MFLTTISTPTPPPDPRFTYINSATSSTGIGGYDYGAIGKWALDGLAYLFDFLDPIVSWGGKVIIIGCFIIYWCSGEKKYIASALKCAIIVLIFWVIRGAV
jgi:hypothetical protein